MKLQIEDVGVVACTQGGETVGYYVKGHLDLQEVARVVEAVMREDGFDADQISEAPKPKHEMWRKVPVRGGVTSCRFERNATGPGAFAVTHVEIERWK